MESMKVRLLTITALALGFLAAAAVFGVAPATANGIHPNARDVFSGAVGPYFLRVTTAPIVGNMHFVVYLSQADGIGPVEQAEIALWGRLGGEDPQSVGPVSGVASLDGPNLFTVDLPVDEVGQWVFTLRVRGSLGEDSVDIPLTVSRRGSVNLGVVGILLVLVVVAGLAALSWGRKRRKRRGRGARR